MIDVKYAITCHSWADDGIRAPACCGAFDGDRAGRTLDAALFALHEQIRRGLSFPEDLDARELARRESRAAEIVRDSVAGLPAVRALLEADVRAAFEGDPAAMSIDEAVFCYPLAGPRRARRQGSR